MDGNLRSVMRQHTLSRSAVNEARLLKERLRAGELSSDQLMLAAAAGIESAGMAIGMDAENAAKICAEILPAASYPQHRGLFSTIWEQVAALWQLNLCLGWGFSANDFVSLPVPTPRFAQSMATTLVLVPYAQTVEQTVSRLWDALEIRALNADIDGKVFFEAMRLKDGVDHPGRCLRWEWIDLFAHWIPTLDEGVDPVTVRDPRLAHAGVFAAAVLHPQWAANLDGRRIPFVWLSGYLHHTDRLGLYCQHPDRHCPWSPVLLMKNRIDFGFYAHSVPLILEVAS